MTGYALQAWRGVGDMFKVKVAQHRLIKELSRRYYSMFYFKIHTHVTLQTSIFKKSQVWRLSAYSLKFLAK